MLQLAYTAAMGPPVHAVAHFLAAWRSAAARTEAQYASRLHKMPGWLVRVPVW